MISVMPEIRPIREELQATLDARRDLGPEYEPALVESFVERLDDTIAARVRAELDAHGRRPAKKQKSRGSEMTPVALGSLALGIPLTGIASANAGLTGLAITWIAIAVINVAAALAISRRD